MTAFPLIERVRRLAEKATLRQQIVSEVMKLLPGVLEQREQKPTIDELERLLNAEDTAHIQINPDGTIGEYRPAKVGDIADAVMRLIEPSCTDAPTLADVAEQALKALEDAADAFKRFASIYRPGSHLNKTYLAEEARIRHALALVEKSAL